MGGCRREDCCDRQEDGATFFLQWGICGSLEQVGGFSSCFSSLSPVGTIFLWSHSYPMAGCRACMV